MKSIKKTLCLFLIILMTVSVVTPVMANSDIKVKIDGEQIEFDVPPQLINDRTMVPLRAIFEALGATVDWNGETQTVTSTKKDTTISLTINNPTMYVNGAAVTLDSPACLVGGRTLVPVRAISEAFGTTVDWIGSESTVVINSKSEEPEGIPGQYVRVEVNGRYYDPVEVNNKYFSKDSRIEVRINQPIQLNAVVYPENATVNNDVTWKYTGLSEFLTLTSDGLLNVKVIRDYLIIRACLPDGTVSVFYVVPKETTENSDNILKVEMDKNSAVAKNVAKLKKAIKNNGQRTSGGYGFKTTYGGAVTSLLYLYEDDVCTFSTEIPASNGGKIRVTLQLYEDEIPVVSVFMNDNLTLVGNYLQPSKKFNTIKTPGGELEEILLQIIDGTYETFDAFINIIALSSSDFKNVKISNFGISY